MTRDPFIDALARELEAQDEEVDAGLSSDDPLASKLCRPLNEAALERIEARVLETLRSPGDDKVVPISRAPKPRRARAAGAGAILASLALAAGIVLYVSVLSEHNLPAYQLDVVGGGQALRNAPLEPSARVALVPGSELEVVARPATAVHGKIDARMFFVRGGEIRPWRPRLEISADGAVRATAAPSSWSEMGPGAWDLVVLIGQDDDLPAESDVPTQWIAEPERFGVQLLRYPVDVRR